MAAIAEPPPTAAGGEIRLGRADGVELLGPVSGSGYHEGAALVRRADGQMVQLGPLMYRMLEAVDGQRDNNEIAAAMSQSLGRRVGEDHVTAIAQKLAAQGLLAGSEHHAPPRRNPLLALRWKVLVSDPKLTRRLTAPFGVLFSPFVMWPALAAFVVVFWFVLIHKGVASATAQAFHSPGLLLLVFVLAVASAGFHEFGHAAACRYGGATPGGMGMGMYLVWPAFYTDVTDSYRLPKRARLRVDLGGLYFNAIVADVTLGVWLLVRSDALLLVVALQVLQMVKQLSPVIRADGYHILSDATGVPDLYSHMGPTLRRLLPGRPHEPSALKGWARALVTAWVIIMVPVLISMSASAIILLPRLMTSAWDSGQHIVSAVPHQVSSGQIIDVLAAIVRLLALALPVLGSILVTQKIVRTMGTKVLAWTSGRPGRRAVAAIVTAGIGALLVWALWPSDQYRPVRPDQGGTIGGMIQLVSSPAAVARPSVGVPAPAPARVQLTPGTHLAVSMIPVEGATRRHPALFVIQGSYGRPPIAILSSSTPAPSPPPTSTTPATSATTTDSGAPTATATTAETSASAPSASSPATAFPFRLPAAPGPGDTQALAVNTTNGGVLYDVAYSLVTVRNGANVSQTNSAYALADCHACTTVAVSFQVVLVVGESRIIAPIDAAGSLNVNCPACSTTAIADQIVVTLHSQPSQALLNQLNAALAKLNALPELGAGGSPAAVAAAVSAVQQQIDTQLAASGELTNPPQQTPSGTSSTSSSATSTIASSSSSAGSGTTSSSAAPPSSSAATPPVSTTATTPATTTPTTATTTTTGQATTSPSPGTSASATSTTPAGGSGSG
jgi:putative peptide zinc metalloprotease protein